MSGQVCAGQTLGPLRAESLILLKHRKNIHPHKLVHRGAIKAGAGEREGCLLVDVPCQLSVGAGGGTGEGLAVSSDGTARDVVEVPVEPGRGSLREG